jgi:hypothetical protein
MSWYIPEDNAQGLPQEPSREWVSKDEIPRLSEPGTVADYLARHYGNMPNFAGGPDAPPDLAEAVGRAARTVADRDDGQGVLREMVAELTYKPGWTFTLKSSPWRAGWAGILFEIRVETTNNIRSGEDIRVRHSMPVPVYVGGDPAYWRRWIFDQIVNVERHEAAELFQIGEERPFFPDHGPAADPYAVRDRLTEGHGAYAAIRKLAGLDG